MTITSPKAYDALADFYDGLRLTNREKEENRFIYKYLRDRGYVVGEVLETGSGTGRMIDYLDDQIPSGKYLGIDSSTEMTAIAKAKHPRYAFSVNDMRRLPVLDKAVDSAISVFGGFSYLVSQLEAEDGLREKLRVLRPGGKLFLMVWAAWAIQEGIFDVKIGDDVLQRRRWGSATLWAAVDRAFEGAKVWGHSGRWLRWLPSWAPRRLFRFLFWLERKTWGKWYPDACTYLICEATAPRPSTPRPVVDLSI